VQRGGTDGGEIIITPSIGVDPVNALGESLADEVMGGIGQVCSTLSVSVDFQVFLFVKRVDGNLL